MSSVMGREAGALLIAMALALAAMPRMIVWLRRLGARQSIHEDVPEAHQAKAGTPTMGGVVILLALATATLWLTGFDVLTGPALLLTLAFGAIGFLDDLLIAKRGKNLGLRAREKLALQVIAATLFVVVVSRFTSAAGPAGGWLSLEPLARLLSAPLAGVWPGAFGAAYVVLDVLFLLGLANAVNFSDGLDGLAGGLTVIAALTAALLLPPGLQNTLGVFLFALAGGCLGFLWFNCNPARVFMGDTGSLALGGALGAVAVLTRTELLFFIVGAVYWAELFSVILQVISFKTTGRRIFRMSPIHHHLELVGWKEGQIVTRFWLAGAATGALALLLRHF